MLEDIESSKEHLDSIESNRESITPEQSEYINECVEAQNPDALIERIDELSNYVPPKAIDKDEQVLELIEPVREEIDAKYLEAPSDLEQISQIGDYLADVEDLKFENWCELSTEDRQTVLQMAEYKIAEIEHRNPCQLNCQDMPYGSLGYYDPMTKQITLNSRYVNSNEFVGYKETLDTLIHEGRHAYQDYNMKEREVHPREGEVNMWKWNQEEIGYQDCNLVGWEIYAMQPVESDARAFAEDVLNHFNDKIA